MTIRKTNFGVPVERSAIWRWIAPAIDAALAAQAAEHDRRVAELLAANNREVERRRSAEAWAKALCADWQEAQDWYRQNEKAIRAAGIEPPPDFLVPF